MAWRRYRQLFLFLAVLILPAGMIAVQGRRLWIQEQELTKTRLEEIRKRTAAEIGQDIVTRLERIRTQEMANAPPTPIRRSTPRDAAVVAVGWVDGERLVWPWDLNPISKQTEEKSEFARLLDAGRRAEFADRQYGHAADLYRQAADAARDDDQRASARLGVARTQLRIGRRTAAVATYREVLKLPSTLIDANGLSYWSSAATPLVELGAGLAVLQRVNADLESPVIWAPVQMYRFRTILEALRSSQDQAVARDAGFTLETLGPRLLDVETAEKVQKDFPKLPVSETNWQPYQGTAELWLIGRSPEGVEKKPLVLAVKWEAIRHAVESDRLSRHVGPRFQIAVAGAGDPLSEYLPDLRITFPDGVAGATAGFNPQRSMWGLSLVLVTMFTLLGGFLLWRDMRREAHIAELRTQFVSSVSHELKTPLTSIRMFAELLQMRESNDAQQVHFLETIVGESERLTRLLNNVLDFSRIERGQKTYRLEPAPLADVVQAAVRTIQYPLAQQGFVLDLNVCEGIPPVAVDRDALQQAILNLLTNAMKYSGERREIGLRVCTENGSALIQVSDRGIGIHEREQSRIFEKFYRVPIPENREISGTGLGLSLVAHIVEAHGGRVQVNSRPGQGSTFSILLPVLAGGGA